MNVRKFSKNNSQSKNRKANISSDSKLMRSQTIGLWASVILSLIFSSISLWLGLNTYLENEKEKCLMEISLVRNNYETACGVTISETKGRFSKFNMLFNATVTNISKNPISIVDYKTFGPFIRNYPSQDFIDFDVEKLTESFNEMSNKFQEPIRIEPGSFHRFKFNMMVWTKVEVIAPEPLDIMTFLENIYLKKTDLFGNKIDFETDEEDYINKLSYPNLDSITEYKHHLVLKTAKGNYLVKEINWYNNSNLGIEIFNWVFDPEGEMQPSYMF